MQSVFGINMVVMDRGQPKTMNLREVLKAFIQHRREVVTRRTMYDLAARARGHILEGLGVALVSIDEMIALIKAAKNLEASDTERHWPLGKVSEMLGEDHICRPDDLPEDYGAQPGG